MAELKTQENDASVEVFIKAIPDERRRAECFTILEMMKQVTGAEPKMWGESIIGFGNVHYKYATGREGDWFHTGFSPRKQNLTLYLVYGFEKHTAILQRLGKYKTGKACLYINKLQDINLEALRELVEAGLREKVEGFSITTPPAKDGG
jgi:hypothetical protein